MSYRYSKVTASVDDNSVRTSRRTFLTTVGSAGAAALAGCLDDDSDGENPEEGQPTPTTTPTDTETPTQTPDDGDDGDEDNGNEDPGNSENGNSEDPKDDEEIVEGLRELEDLNNQLFQESIAYIPDFKQMGDFEFAGFDQTQYRLLLELADLLDVEYNPVYPESTRDYLPSKTNLKSESNLSFREGLFSSRLFEEMDVSLEGIEDEWWYEGEWHFEGREEDDDREYLDVQGYTLIDNEEKIMLYGDDASEDKLKVAIEFVYGDSEADRLQLDWDIPDGELVPAFGINEAVPNSWRDTNEYSSLIHDRGYNKYVNYYSIDLENPELLTEEGKVKEKLLGQNQNGEWDEIKSHVFRRDLEDILVE